MLFFVIIITREQVFWAKWVGNVSNVHKQNHLGTSGHGTTDSGNIYIIVDKWTNSINSQST